VGDIDGGISCCLAMTGGCTGLLLSPLPAAATVMSAYGAERVDSRR